MVLIEFYPLSWATWLVDCYFAAKARVDSFFNNLPVEILELLRGLPLAEIDPLQATITVGLFGCIFVLGGANLAVLGYPTALTTPLYYAGVGCFLHMYAVYTGKYVYSDAEWLSLQWAGSLALRGPVYSAVVNFLFPDVHPYIIFLLL